MGYSIVQKILASHLVNGVLKQGTEIAIRIDQTITQDATGTMAYLQFEAMGISKIKTELTVSYIDHNTLQTGFENADDHKFLQGMAAKYGAFFSRAGNGICHQVHLERFGIPGKTMLGSDSHTTTAGGLGMLAVGVGGLDVAVAMGGGSFYLTMPKVVNVRLHGSLPPWSTAKDVVLEVLRRLTVKGGVGKVLEYGGDGIKTLSVPERATITNMGAETGATTSIFPSDEVTRYFLRAQGREDIWRELAADHDAVYNEVLDIDLNDIEPMAACPHSPDNVKKVSAVGSPDVDQVVIGSCTNSSYLDLMRVAAVLKGRTVHPGVNFVIAPGSRQVYAMLAKNGALADMVLAGARILECACGPCIGMGQAPPSNGISIRTNNRNFKGRCGTASAGVYLVSPETAAAAAITGKLTDPRVLGAIPLVEIPESFCIDDSNILAPAENSLVVEITRGPNIKSLPIAEPFPGEIAGPVLIKVGDNITTDHIMPAGAKVLPLRSNIPAMAEHVFAPVDPSFVQRAKEAKVGIILGGDNYGQGSSREHAALAPMYLGIKIVLAKTFARIHKDNLINFGILPVTFTDPVEYDRVEQGDVLEVNNIHACLKDQLDLEIKNKTRNFVFKAHAQMTSRQVEILMAGGLLNFTSGRQ
ncbi:aconitase [Desulfotomaculum arcticum]|uniref:Aconitase n=1 Tax=Desulfotruncus arcticus DSM 17038 TaxID=1121424 RepID=A0A1I2WPB4_9FIRM|nr:aconitate hydratase [Desulfotruncus arcticus]SFH02489.1 aconitase [Desulfotomaculum arcticum] [Desulfotruncus arcticus DSM 17038]